MDSVHFYYKGQLCGIGELPDRTMTFDRHKIAKNVGVRIYDRILFITDSGKVRMDTDTIKDKKFIDHELNVWL